MKFKFYFSLILMFIFSFLMKVEMTQAASVYAYIPNSGSDTVSIINTADNSLTTVSVGDFPRGVGVSPTGDLAYITNRDDNSVSVINMVTNAVINPAITTGIGVAPYGVAVTPDGEYAYVANSTGNSVSVITADTLTVDSSPIAVGTAPAGVAIASVSGSYYVYVANTGTDNVTVIQASNNTVIKTIDVGEEPIGVAVSPDGSKVFVACSDGNSVSVIQTSDNTVLTTITDIPSPSGVVVSVDGNYAYVSNTAPDTITIINVNTLAVVQTIPAGGSSPFGVSVTPDGSSLYVANSVSDTASQIAIPANTLSSTVSIQSGPFSLGLFITPLPSTLIYRRRVTFDNNGPQTVDVTNDGNGALRITRIFTTSGFDQTNNCGAILTAGGTCTISVTSDGGNSNGTLFIESDAADSPITVELINDLVEGSGCALSQSRSNSLGLGFIGLSLLFLSFSRLKMMHLENKE